MRTIFTITLLSCLALTLSAQTVPAPAPAAPAPAAAATPAPPAPGTIKWRGALWASGAASNEDTADGSLFLRSMDAGDGQLALDALQVGADVTLTDGFTLKFTLLSGQDAKVLNATSMDTGSIAFPEAQLIWTGDKDTFRLGRMYTAMGMEVMDQTQDITASRGLLFTYAIPLGQVGADWHHTFTPVWSTDLYVYNGEDKITDNNKSKTLGVGVTYNHAGASDKFVTLMAFSGAEQTSTGASATNGAEGRKRNRLSLAGQWTWGASTLQFEGEAASEPFLASEIAGSQGSANVTAKWSGLGLIYKYQINDFWSVNARAEEMQDNTGVRLNGDTTVNTTFGGAMLGTLGADLSATSFAIGVERKWHATFSRLEVRQDSLNKNVLEGAADAGKPFKSATSMTWSIGTSF